MLSSDKHRLFIDIETYSSADIKTGVFKYTEADDFEILLIAYALDDGPVQMLDLTAGTDLDELERIGAMLTDPNIIKVAHNSAFERNALDQWVGHYLYPEQWEDTMILAAYNGLPLSLEAAGAAMGLPVQKIREGTLLINYFCKPCKQTKANGGRTRNLPQHAPDKWERFCRYCARDVEVCQEIYRRLHRFPVTDFERRIWALDARINERGVLVDRELAAAAVAVDEAFSSECFEELRMLTGLDNPNSVAQLKAWLEGRGLFADALDKEAVAAGGFSAACLAASSAASSSFIAAASSSSIREKRSLSSTWFRKCTVLSPLSSRSMIR